MPDPNEMKPYTPEQLKEFMTKVKKNPLPLPEERLCGLIPSADFLTQKTIEGLSDRVAELESRIKTIENEKRPSLIIKLDKSQVEAVLKVIEEASE